MTSFNYDPLYTTMKKMGISFDDLRKQAKLGPQTVEKLINGDRVMISVIAKLCLVLGCDYSDVVGLNYEWDIENDNKDI